MQTNTTVRDPSSQSTSGDPDRPKSGAKTLIEASWRWSRARPGGGHIQSSRCGEHLFGDHAGVRRDARTDCAWQTLSDDLALCQLDMEGMELTYPGPLVAQTVARYAAACPPDRGGDVVAAPSD